MSEKQEACATIMMKKNEKITKEQKVGLVIGLLLAMILIYLDAEGIISVNQTLSLTRMVMHILFAIGLIIIVILLCYLMLLLRVKKIYKKRNQKAGVEAEAQDEQEMPVNKMQSCDTAGDNIENVDDKKSQKEKTAMSLEAKRALCVLRGRERLKSYESNKEVIEPPCYKDKIYEIYDSYKRTGYSKSRETPFEKLHDDFPLIPKDDLDLLIQYFKESDDYCEDVCCAFAMIYDTVGIPQTAEAETDKNRVIKICMTRYPWMKKEHITSMLSRICWLCNR